MLFVEEEASRLDSNELFYDFFFGDVGEDQVLGVVWEDTEAVGDFSGVFFLFVEDSF